jgi:DNA-binding response OmpR family regulator
MKKILLIDDQPEILEVINDFIDLNFEDFVVEHCQSVSEALQKLSQDKYDVICTDLNLPKHSGRELIISLRDNAGINNNTPVILITGSEITMEDQIFQYEETYLFYKNDEMNDLINLIRELIETE